MPSSRRVVAGALWLDLTFEPPFWVHLLTTLPLALPACLGLLRPLKGVSIALQFVHQAAEGNWKK